MMLKTPGWKWNIVTSFAEVWIEILDNFYKMRVDRVTSFAEVWIEIYDFSNYFYIGSVTSFAEVWIEIKMH